jgi:hypothetical protein
MSFPTPEEIEIAARKVLYHGTMVTHHSRLARLEDPTAPLDYGNLHYREGRRTMAAAQLVLEAQQADAESARLAETGDLAGATEQANKAITLRNQARAMVAAVRTNLGHTA